MTIQLYTRPDCGYCTRAKDYLNLHELGFEEIDLGHSPDRTAEMVQRSGRRSVPQIFIDGASIGGYDDLIRIGPSDPTDR